MLVEADAVVLRPLQFDAPCAQATDKHVSLERAETPPEPTSNVPFRRDLDFIERGDLLERIGAKVSQPAARVALVGLGGIGYGIGRIWWTKQD